jgi:hypothetical protein
MMVGTRIPCKYWDIRNQACTCKDRKFIFIFQDTTCPKVEDSDSKCDHFKNNLGPRPTCRA